MTPLPTARRCPKHDDCRAETATILRWMRLHREEYRDQETGEVNCTGLAEGAAFEFDHDEWLDDEQSPVWDLAIVAAGRPA